MFRVEGVYFDRLDVLNAGSAQGGVLAIGGHGQDRVQRVVVGGAETAHHVKQFPGIGEVLCFKLHLTSSALLKYLLKFQQ